MGEDKTSININAILEEKHVNDMARSLLPTAYALVIWGAIELLIFSENNTRTVLTEFAKPKAVFITVSKKTFTIRADPCDFPTDARAPYPTQTEKSNTKTHANEFWMIEPEIAFCDLNGLMDTGNNLIDPVTRKKVIIINKKVDEDFMLVPYKTINNESLIKCFKPKRVFIDGIGERKDVLVGVINKKFVGFNCLLNNELLKEEQ